jgi:hypothetical protein
LWVVKYLSLIDTFSELRRELQILARVCPC